MTLCASINVQSTMGKGVVSASDQRVRVEGSPDKGDRPALLSSGGQGDLPKLQGSVGNPLSQDGLAAVRALPLPSAVVRASQRLTLSDGLVAGAFSASDHGATSSIYCAKVMWGRGRLAGRPRRSPGLGSSPVRLRGFRIGLLGFALASMFGVWLLPVPIPLTPGRGFLRRLR